MERERRKFRPYAAHNEKRTLKLILVYGAKRNKRELAPPPADWFFYYERIWDMIKNFCPNNFLDDLSQCGDPSKRSLLTKAASCAIYLYLYFPFYYIIFFKCCQCDPKGSQSHFFFYFWFMNSKDLNFPKFAYLFLNSLQLFIRLFLLRKLLTLAL